MGQGVGSANLIGQLIQYWREGGSFCPFFAQKIGVVAAFVNAGVSVKISAYLF